MFGGFTSFTVPGQTWSCVRQNPKYPSSCKNCGYLTVSSYFLLQGLLQLSKQGQNILT